MNTIDISKGTMISTLSNQWASRPDDQRFTSLNALYDQVADWANRSNTKTLSLKDISVVGNGSLKAHLNGDTSVDHTMTNWSFRQLASVVGAPSAYLQSLPAALTAVNLNYGLQTADKKSPALYVMDQQNGTDMTIRGITSQRYGRIYDHEVVKAVQNIAGDGTGDTRWKIPGTINWNSEFGIVHNPNVDITKENTTLYASDRDVFMFLCDDRNPIEVGKLPNGNPDLMFRGFYVWNSEVGSRTFGFASMYLRGVCQNRCLWGVEGFSQIKFKHTKSAPDRFALEVGPKLAEFGDQSTTKLRLAVDEAKSRVVAKTDEERETFLMKLGFSAKQAEAIVSNAEIEECKKPESLWDMSQAVSAIARQKTYQDQRVGLESIAGRILEKCA